MDGRENCYAEMMKRFRRGSPRLCRVSVCDRHTVIVGAHCGRFDLLG